MIVQRETLCCPQTVKLSGEPIGQLASVGAPQTHRGALGEREVVVAVRGSGPCGLVGAEIGEFRLGVLADGFEHPVAKRARPAVDLDQAFVYQCAE